MPEGVEPFFGDENNEQKQQSILRFSDQAMQEFFEKIKQKPYYKNTVFVLMSDHTGGTHKTIAARYFIPGIIYAEDLLPKAEVSCYVSQRDFSPSVLELLGLPASPSFAGESFLPKSESMQSYDRHFADYFDSGIIGWLNENRLVETSVSNPSEIKCYSLDKGLLNAESLSCDERHKAQSIKSLVFTSHSQHLLFTGETRKFYSFYE